MKLLLVRHGATEANLRGVLLGRRADPGLVEEGRRQAQLLAQALAPQGPARVVSSPLRRCIETAEAIAAVVSSNVAVDDRLVEIDYGDWEGVALSDIPPEASQRWRDDPGFRPPQGESLDEVSARVSAWCEEQTGDSPLVAVTHVSPIKAAVAWTLGAPPSLAWRLFVGVASVTTIGIQPHGGVLLGFNDCAHLASLTVDRP